MEALAEGEDWLEIERLIREHVGLSDALRILETPRSDRADPDIQRTRCQYVMVENTST